MLNKFNSMISVVALFNLNLFSTALAQGVQATNTRPHVDAKPIALDWKSVKWPSLDYARIPVEGGAALYTLASSDARKFRMEWMFPANIYAISETDIVSFDAASDLVLLGGAGKRSFDEIQKELQDRGLKLSTSLKEGHFTLTAEGLSTDLAFASTILSDVILHPRFDINALNLWKQEKADSFEGMLDASSLKEQYLFIAQEANKVGLGAGHDFTKNLARQSRKQTSAVSYADVKRLAQLFQNRNGLNVVLSGTFSKKDEKIVLDIMQKISRQSPVVESWMPGRSQAIPNDKVRIVVIDKPDMSQAAVTLRYFLTKLGGLNRIEKARLDLLEEVYSSSGGVVGNDRFSKAMRADSGISYSSHADIREKYIAPNNNVGVWVMNYQSPNERIFESIEIALKTANEFLQKGISDKELENTRIARMNSMLSREETIFNKASRMAQDIVKNKIPQPTPIEVKLARYDIEMKLDVVNETLNRLRESQFVPVLVLMGHPSEQTINQLKSDKRFEVSKVISFDDLKKELM